jgi:ribosomal protein S18 acetylase RimI-like enzyme
VRKYWFVADQRGAEDTEDTDDTELELSLDPADEDVRVLIEGLERFNESNAFGADRTKVPAAVFLRRHGQVVGGACGDTHYGWLYLSLLWLHEEHRRRGWGRRLVERFEAEGVARGCLGVWVSTYAFQAPTFYERLGYREVGRIDDFPRGSARIFYTKPLPPSR